MSDKMEARFEVQRSGPESLVKEVQDEIRRLAEQYNNQNKNQNEVSRHKWRFLDLEFDIIRSTKGIYHILSVDLFSWSVIESNLELHNGGKGSNYE